MDDGRTLNVIAQVGDGPTRAHFDHDVEPGGSLLELPYSWWLSRAQDDGVADLSAEE